MLSMNKNRTCGFKATCFCIVFISSSLASLTIGQECGTFSKRSGARIAGGHRAGRGSYPSYVNYRIPKNFAGDYDVCGGVLIDNMHILTAASCLAGEIRGDFEIRDSNYKTVGFSTKHCISQNYVDEANTPDGPKVNNLALIKVDEPIEYSDDLQPACIPPPRQIGYDETAYAVGMGQTETSKKVRQLMALDVKRSYCDQEGAAEGVLCFKDANVARGQPCMGDMGGPVYGYFDGKQTVVGIASYGPLSCDPNSNADYMFTDALALGDELQNMISNCY